MSSIEKTCGICLCSSLNCNLDSPCSHSQLHTFHSDCIGQWLQTIYSKCLHMEPTCPTCRTVLNKDYIDNSKLEYIKTKYNSSDIYTTTIKTITWRRRLYPLDSIYAGYPFYMEPIVYISDQIGNTKTLKIDNYQDIVYLGAGIGSKIIAYVSSDRNNADKILYVYNKAEYHLPKAEDYVTSYQGKTLEFVWKDGRYTAHVFNNISIDRARDNRESYTYMLSNFYNSNNYMTDAETIAAIDELNTNNYTYLNQLLDAGRIPNSSEHYEFTLLSKCIEKGFYDIAHKILDFQQYFPTSVDLAEAIENGTPELYTKVINHNLFVESRQSRRYIEYNSAVPQEVKTLYRTKFNYGI